MARFIGSICKLSRKLGMDLNLNKRNGRDISTKCKLKVFPGQHGNKRKRLIGNYSIQLNAKQTLKYFYGVLEKQFKRYYNFVSIKKGLKGELLLQLLESRLDNVVYRMGFASTRREARQLISHKSIVLYNNNIEKIVNISSYIVKSGDVLRIRDKCKKQGRILDSIKNAENIGFSSWIDVDVKNMTGIFIRVPERKELPSEFNEQLVIELYSK